MNLDVWIWFFIFREYTKSKITKKKHSLDLGGTVWCSENNGNLKCKRFGSNMVLALTSYITGVDNLC